MFTSPPDALTLAALTRPAQTTTPARKYKMEHGTLNRQRGPALDLGTLVVERFVTTVEDDGQGLAGWVASHDTNCDTGLCCR